MDFKYHPKDLFLDGYDYNVRSENEKESTDKETSKDLPPMPPLEVGEEVKEGKGLEILTPNKLLARLPILLAQMKAGNNSYNLKKAKSFVSA